MQQTVNHEEDSRRECHGRVLAISRKVDLVARDSNDIFYLVESESHNEVFYSVRYKYGTNAESEWCSCNDFTNRAIMCKHIYAVQYATRMGIFKDKNTRKEFAEQFRKTRQLEYSQANNNNEDNNDLQVPPKKLTVTITDSRDKVHSWMDDKYDF